MRHYIKWGTRLAVLMAMWVAFSAAPASALITGVTGPSFTFTAGDGYIDTPEGNTVYFWGLANDAGPVQYPAPTMIVNQGDAVTVTLINNLAVNVSLLFPGQTDVVATGGVPGQLTQEAPPSGTVTYSFIANNPGTFMYQSGTNMRLQVEMGIVGALIIRPATPNQAYNHTDSAYDREVLFLETEMDPIIHELVETGNTNLVDWSKYFPAYWFLNGRCAPDTMSIPNAAWLPHQPYNSFPRIHPNEKLLLRIVNAGNGVHPFHTHANHMRIIAQDGVLLESAPGNGADLSYLDYTLTVSPGGTADAMFSWSGERLGWDVYGHAPGDPMEPGEYAPDHGKPIPVTLPTYSDLRYGDSFSGSPFLGQLGFTPPGVNNNNMDGGYFYMWHSHKEKEMVNNDVFPGGMMTMLIIEHPSVLIDEMAP